MKIHDPEAASFPSREQLGRRVREVWVEWAKEQPDPKPSWLLPWEELDPGDREVDMRIGAELFDLGMDTERDFGLVSGSALDTFAQVTAHGPVGEPYVPPADAPGAFLVDLDGTLALMNGRGPYDEGRVIEDLPNTPVIETVRALIASGLDPVFMSGRTDGCRADTEVWLLTHVFQSEMITPRLYAPLLMRATGDVRPDSVVKLELFDKHVRHQYLVRLALDDRDPVVKMWRSIGLTCLQVAPGNF